MPSDAGDGGDAGTAAGTTTLHRRYSQFHELKNVLEKEYAGVKAGDFHMTRQTACDLIACLLLAETCLSDVAPVRRRLRHLFLDRSQHPPLLFCTIPLSEC
jgi:hypothetical protein